jgi:hypothetical protein
MALNRRFIGACISLFFLAAPAFGATLPVRCDFGQSLSEALKWAFPGSTLAVTGDCVEAVTLVRDDVTIDGQGSATLRAPTDNEVALLIEGARRVRIQNITVKQSSIGIFARKAGSLDLSNVTIQDNIRRGLQVGAGSSARIVGPLAVTGTQQFGISVDTAGLMILVEGASVQVSGNGSAFGPSGTGVLVGASASLLVDNGSTISSSNNAGPGFQVLGGATLSVSFDLETNLSSSLTAQGNGGPGLSMDANSFLNSAGGTVTLTGNTGADFEVDNGSNINIEVFDPSFPVSIGAASFERYSTGSLSGVTIGNVTTDGTAIVSCNGAPIVSGPCPAN